MKNWLGWVVVVFIFFSLVSPIFAQTANLNLHLNTQVDLKIDQEFSVLVEIMAFEKTLGTDLKLSYNPDKLELTQVIPGPVYPNFSNLEDLTQVRGELYLSGAADFTTGLVPNGKLADLKFRPKKAGQTTIEVVFNPTDTTSTAIIPFSGNNLNLLTQAPEPLTINIKAYHWWQTIFNWVKNLWQDLT